MDTQPQEDQMTEMLAKCTDVYSDNYKMQMLEKRLAEIEYRTAIPKADEVKELLILMREFKLQRMHFGNITFEMQYQQLTMGAGTQSN